MPAIRTMFLDLDGTLTDPREGIMRCFGYALERLGRTMPSPEPLNWIGPPLHETFRALLGDEVLVQRAVELYRERFASVGLFENRLIDGVPEALASLKQAGVRLVVATSKAEMYSVRIVEHFGLDRYLEAVVGAAPDGSDAAKADILRRGLARAGEDPTSSVMVGDREHDILGAAAVGMAGWGVLWGYGSREELVAAGARRIAVLPHDLVSFVNER